MNSLVYIVNLILVGSFAFAMWRKSSRSLRKFFWTALLSKLIAGISLGLIYAYYYNGNDTFSFFNDAKTLANVCRINVYEYIQFLWSGDQNSALSIKLYYVEPRSLFFVKELSLISLITSNNYWISSLWLSLLSFSGCWYLFIRLTDFFTHMKWPAALSLFFFPSFVFWGSGVIKESSAAAALCFIIGVFLLVINKQKPSLVELIITILSLFVLWNLKYYWAAILIPTLITSLIFVYVIERNFTFKNKALETGIWLIVFLTLSVGVSFVHPNFYFDRLLFVIVENHDLFVKISAPESTIHFHQLQPEWYSMLINAPWALISGLFRPFVFESTNVVQIIAGVENVFLFIFFIISMKRLKLIGHSPSRLIIYSAIVYISLLCIFLALSTPNFGTLSRYRIGFLPVLCLLIFYENPLLNKFTFLRK